MFKIIKKAKQFFSLHLFPRLGSPVTKSGKAKSIFVLFVLAQGFIYFFTGCSQRGEAKLNSDRVRDFDSGWRFINDSTISAGDPAFNDAAWRIVDLPHDWSIEALSDQVPGKTIGPFTKESGGPRNGASTGHVLGGTGWYRKTFRLDEKDKGQLVSVYFEGAYMETDVWVNGNHLGSQKHGYTSFFYDITKHCNPVGEENIIAVRVVNKGQNSRWYSGSGIYRHVKMIVTNPLHVEQWGVHVTTPNVSDDEATIKIQAAIANENSERGILKVRTRVLDSTGRVINTAETTIDPFGDSKTKTVQDIVIKSPALWSPQLPALYTAEVAVYLDGKLQDVITTEFGIRSINFSAEKGFLLNGKSVKLKGGCIHHDNGILGAAAIDRAEERKVELLKANGFNAIRSSHYPPSQKFLEACDRLGMLVIDEAFDMWQRPKNTHDYHLYFDEYWESDISSMVLRDRNHPSIILWSMGNEIEERADSSGVAIMQKFRNTIQKLDSTRPLTLAVNEFWDHPGRKWQQTEPAFAQADVAGYNYQWWEYENDHKSFPHRVIMGTESVPIHAFENWQLVEKHPYVIGDFVWTGMDYLGESGIGHTSCEGEKDEQLMPWPWFNAWCGDIDLVGTKKPQSYYRDVVWRNSKVEMAVRKPLPNGCKELVSYWGWPNEEQSWTWPGNEGLEMEVKVYTRSPLVRLLLNGKTIGEKRVSDSTKLTAVFKVPYEAGELKAIAIEDGREAGSVVLKSAGAPKSIRLTADRDIINANRNDLSYITVEITDENNHVIPNSAVPVEIIVSGAGELASAGNANPSDMRDFKSPLCNTFRGRCLAIIRPKGAQGKINVEVRSANLPTAKLVIKTR